MENEQNECFDLDDDLPDMDGDQTPDYWACYGCGKSYGVKPMGGTCPSCNAYVEEEYF